MTLLTSMIRQPITHLSETQLLARVPSIFTFEAHESRSDKYSLIPTIECIKALGNEGFKVTWASESRTRLSNNKPYTKHLVRLRHESQLGNSENVPEIVLVNSHNGASAYQLRAGIFRIVCSNGLIAGDESFSQRVRHQGDVVNKVVEATHFVAKQIPDVMNKAEEWKGITIEGEARRIYAESAAMLRWDKEEVNIDTDRLLQPRRNSDLNKDLWTTFNLLQEKIIRGGTPYLNQDKTRRARTRAVNSVNENVKLNTALWNLTSKMGELLKQ